LMSFSGGSEQWRVTIGYREEISVYLDARKPKPRACFLPTPDAQYESAYLFGPWEYLLVRSRHKTRTLV